MGLMTILSWIVFGFIVGAIGRLLVPGRQRLGWLATIALGIVGSFLGGFMKFMIWGGEPFQASGILMSTVGAIIVVVTALKLGEQKRMGSM